MRSLPDQVSGCRSVRPVSVLGAIGPYLGLAGDGLRGHRVTDAALTLLAAVFAERGPVREELMAERSAFEPLLRAVNRCPLRREGA